MQEITTFLSHHQALFSSAVAVVIVLLIVEFLRAKRGSVSINPLIATQLINHQNAAVIDLRDNNAYQSGHIIDALNITLSELKSSNKKIEKLKTKPIIFVCTTGLESQKMAAFLLKQGYNAYSLAGGMRAWLNAQMPIVKEK